MNNNDWGKHLVLDIYDCPIESITSIKHIKAFSKELVKRIDMVPYGPPQVVLFGSGNTEGITLVQLIETSNINAHFVNEYRSGYLDIFSCKDYNVETVVNTVRDFFDPKDWRQRVLLRKKR